MLSIKKLDRNDMSRTRLLRSIVHKTARYAGLADGGRKVGREFIN